MALTPQNNEAFLREVDEEYRREQLLSFWKRYGRLIVGAVVVALVALAGVLYWQHRERVAAEREGETLQTAYDYLTAGDEGGAEKPLATLGASERNGYRALALFAQADVLLQKNDLKGAAAKFAAVAQDASMTAPFRDLALIRQTSAEYDTLEPQAVIQRLSGLAVPGNPYFGSAGELVAAAQLQLGKRDVAGQTFSKLAQDASVPQSIRQRAVQMAGVLGVIVVPPGAAGAATDAASKGKAE